MVTNTGCHFVALCCRYVGCVFGRLSVLSQLSICAACVVDSGTENACYHQSGALARHHRFGRRRSVSRMWREPDQKQIRGYFCSCVFLCPSALFPSNVAGRQIHGLSFYRHSAVYNLTLLVLLPQTQPVACHGRSLSGQSAGGDTGGGGFFYGGGAIEHDFEYKHLAINCL